MKKEEEVKSEYQPNQETYESEYAVAGKPISNMKTFGKLNCTLCMNEWLVILKAKKWTQIYKLEMWLTYLLRFMEHVGINQNFNVSPLSNFQYWWGTDKSQKKYKTGLFRLTIFFPYRIGNILTYYVCCMRGWLEKIMAVLWLICKM